MPKTDTKRAAKSNVQLVPWQAPRWRLGGAAVDPACPLHGIHAGTGRAGGAITHSVTVKNHSGSDKWVQVFLVKDALACWNACAMWIVKPITDPVKVPNQKGAAGRNVDFQLQRIWYKYDEFLGPGEVIRIYWRNSADQLKLIPIKEDEIGKNNIVGGINNNNMRIRLGLSTVDVSENVVTGGSEGTAQPPRAGGRAVRNRIRSKQSRVKARK